MSGYTDFIRDFPGRCNEVLQLAESSAGIARREVTLSLMVASAAIIIPFERLRNTGKNHAAGDRKRFQAAKGKFDKLESRKFLHSNLCNNPSAWRYGETSVLKMNPDLWPTIRDAKSFPAKENVCFLLSVIRNALAHGSIFTQGDEIEEIIFVTQRYEKKDPEKNGPNKNGPEKKPNGFRFVIVSPREFREFLNSWLKFIESLPT